MAERLLLVDGYNVLGAWGEATRGMPIADARDMLIDMLRDYAGYSGQRVVLVFDAWQTGRGARTSEQYGALEVVYTKRGETADHYIERLCDEHRRAVELGRLELRVATSDGVEQTLALGRGAVRLSAREMILEIGQARDRGRRQTGRSVPTRGATVMDRLPEHTRQALEKMRRGEK
ncbi:MAG: NYN domain-containing protein [Clostridiales bacterium]|nr:NYN domain-containing protein [Clostridiales bacterium]